MKIEISVPADPSSLTEWLTPEALEVFWERIFDLDVDYALPLTNNEPRYQNGRQIYHIADFGSDVLAMFAKVLNVQAGLEKSDYFDD